jgi:PAS domain S-box-containing protein
LIRPGDKPVVSTADKPGSLAEPASIEKLQQRVHHLAEDKASLQLVLRLIQQLIPLSGVEDLVRGMLNTIIETIGGTNIKLYYWTGETLHYADFFGEARQVEAIDDPLAMQVANQRKFVELSSDAMDSMMQGDILPGAWTWGFPLLVGEDLIGVAKLENLHVSGHSLTKFLPTFFSHAALLLSNEIRNQSRLQAEAALRAKTDELDSYFNSATDLFCIADIQGYFLKLNPSWEKTLGYPISQLQGQRFLDFVHPDDLQSTLDAISALSGQKTVTNFSNRYRHRDGSYRWIEWHSQPKDNLIYAAARDITERRRIEEELAQHRSHLEELVEQRTRELQASNEALSNTQYTVDNAAWAIFWIDPETARFHYVNRRVCASLGYSKKALLGMGMPDIDPEFPLDCWPDHVRQMRQSNGMTFESRHRRKDGSEFPVEITASISNFHNQEIIVAFATDITSRKMAEANLLKAKEAAEAANRAKSVFLANMSHELRTPLNAVIGFAQLMSRDERIPSDERENLETINRSGKHLLSLINDILEISKIEVGRLKLSFESVDLYELLTHLSETSSIRAGQKGLALLLEQDPDLPRYIKTDVTKLRQVLINLLSNAIKYTSQGEVRITVSGEQKGGAWIIEFAVHDTGPGISKQELELIFSPFYQTQQGAYAGEGTGLGLAISREYSKLLGGKLSVKSRVGKGSVFSLRLPVQLAQAPEQQAEQPKEVIGLAAGQPNYRVLVAEDNLDNQRLIRTLLERAGFDVRVVGDGLQAIEQVRAWQPHFIWMDMRMPVLDGYEATKRIRAMPEAAHIKIAALTASAFEEDREAILEAGCEVLVRKPIQTTELFQVMHDLLGVQYLYAQQDAAQTRLSDGALDPNAIAQLPEELRDELGTAAVQLDLEAVTQLAEQIATHSAPLAQAIKQLATEFRFDAIIESLNRKNANQ